MWRRWRLIILILLVMVTSGCAYYAPPYGLYPARVGVNVGYGVPVRVFRHHQPNYAPRYFHNPYSFNQRYQGHRGWDGHHFH